MLLVGGFVVFLVSGTFLNSWLTHGTRDANKKYSTRHLNAWTCSACVRSDNLEQLEAELQEVMAKDRVRFESLITVFR